MIKMTTSYKTLQNAMTKRKGRAAKRKEGSRCQNDEMKEKMRIRWPRDWGQTYPHPTIFMKFLDESQLPHFQKIGGFYPPLHTPLWLRHSCSPRKLNDLIVMPSIACSTSRPAHLSENNCIPVFNIFELLQNPGFIEDEIEMLLQEVLRLFYSSYYVITDIYVVLKITFMFILITFLTLLLCLAC